MGEMIDWLSQLKQAKKSCIADKNLKKVHYAFENGKEMVEEYNLETNVVTRRAWRYRTGLRTEGKWIIELGDPEPSYTPEENELIKESSSQPFVSRRATRVNLEWRIRNLPYPLETYSIIADKDRKCLIVKTTNKKYYKMLAIPEMERLNLLPEQENISFTHKFNTLIITYKKPDELVDFEKAVLKEIGKIQPKDTDCKIN